MLHACMHYPQGYCQNDPFTLETMVHCNTWTALCVDATIIIFSIAGIRKRSKPVQSWLGYNYVASYLSEHTNH